MTYHIEPLHSDDLPAIENLLDNAFGLSRRTKTSYRLREGSAPVPGLSCIMRDSEIGVAAVISYWPLIIGSKATPALMLGPLAVDSRRKGVGLGLALMQFTIGLAEQQGHTLVLLVGDEPYYARVGFKRVTNNEILLPGPIDRSRFLYLEFEAGAQASASGLVLPPHRKSA
jgi:predicted N-acetyltransferase YhbS